MSAPQRTQAYSGLGVGGRALAVHRAAALARFRAESFDMVFSLFARLAEIAGAGDHAAGERHRRILHRATPRRRWAGIAWT